MSSQPRILQSDPIYAGKLERYHGTISSECIRKKTPLSLEDSRRIVAEFVKHYNEVRLHSAVGYVTPRDTLEVREKQIFAIRDQRLEEARQRRRRLKRTEEPSAYEQIADAGQRETEFPFGRKTARTAAAANRQAGPGISARRAERAQANELCRKPA